MPDEDVPQPPACDTAALGRAVTAAARRDDIRVKILSGNTADLASFRSQLTAALTGDASATTALSQCDDANLRQSLDSFTNQRKSVDRWASATPSNPTASQPGPATPSPCGFGGLGCTTGVAPGPSPSYSEAPSPSQQVGFASGPQPTPWQPPPTNQCADVTAWVIPRTVSPQGPGDCDGKISFYLRNTTGTRVVCDVRLGQTNGRLSGMQTGVNPGAEIGGERGGLWTCGGTGTYAYRCMVQTQPYSDFMCH